MASSAGCASYSKKNIRKELENLEKIDISRLEGNYFINPTKEYYNYGKTQNDNKPDSLKNNNAYQFILNTDFRKINTKDSVGNENDKLSLNLKFKNENLLSIKVYRDSQIVRDTILYGKYKKGMFYLDNKFLDCNGVPYLFGGCRNNKRRIGLTKKGNLLVNEAVSNEGAILLIIGAGYSYNLTYEYQRIINNNK